jgi:predicted TIM-barrel fold metal-dependent hydrolase
MAIEKKGIYDAHTHIFPRDITENWDWYAKQDSTFKGLTYSGPESPVREAWSTPEETIRAADEAGVEVIVMQGWYWNSMELCRRHNDFMAEVIKQYADRFVAYASINPTFGDDAAEEVVRCCEMGFKGVGELGPGGNHFAMDDPGLFKVCAKCQDLGLPMNFHCGEPVGHVYAGKDMTPVRGFYELAERFPDLKLVLAHLGGGLPFYEMMPEVRKLFKNVWYDLAAMPLLYDIKAVRIMVDLVGPEKVCFGTDFPLTIYKRLCQERNFSLFIDNIFDHANLTEQEWNLVMRENMKKLIDDVKQSVK